ncbi:MAG TPA: glycoside hydrolase family 97 catalytic domain-containing protein, partial [Bacteroidales bacterium]
VKPTGLCRTFPNFMTQEGGRGQEYDAWSQDGGNPPFYTTVLPFTRMLAGSFDFTPGTFNFDKPAKPYARVQTTLVKQLAEYMTIYSPLQMASDLPENYSGKAFDFIKQVPCDWDDTKVLNAEIGSYVTIARKDRNSGDWYVGSITNEEKREFTIDLSFLDKDKKYIAQIYADGPDADWKTNPRSFIYQEIPVTCSSSLTLKLAPGGGTAIRLVKK